MTRSQVLTIAGLLGLAPTIAHATIYITNPTAEGGIPAPGDQTHLFSIEEDGTNLLNLGFLTFGASDASVDAIATDSFGTLYGFIYDEMADESTLVVIDTGTLEATLVGAGIPTPGLITGAAFDRNGALWVYDRSDQSVYEYDIPMLSAVGVPIPIPNPGQINGGDLAFDLDGNCYFQGTLTGNTSTPIYACDLDDGSFLAIGEWTRAGPWADPGHSFSGISFSLDPATCEQILLGSDGYLIDELAELNVDTLIADHIVSTGVNISWYNHIDVAGFPSVAQVEACNFCGDGLLDPGEECDDGNLDEGDGCSSVCLIEEVDECVNDKKDWYLMPLEQWPVDSLEYYNWTWYDYVLGAFVGWNSEDASVILMQEVITLDLNGANGVDVSALTDLRYDALYHLWVINIGFDPQGEDADTALALAAELAAWNGGEVGPPLCDGGELP